MRGLRQICRHDHRPWCYPFLPDLGPRGPPLPCTGVGPWGPGLTQPPADGGGGSPRVWKAGVRRRRWVTRPRAKAAMLSLSSQAARSDPVCGPERLGSARPRPGEGARPSSGCASLGLAPLPPRLQAPFSALAPFNHARPTAAARCRGDTERGRPRTAHALSSSTDLPPRLHARGWRPARAEATPTLRPPRS